ARGRSPASGRHARAVRGGRARGVDDVGRARSTATAASSGTFSRGTPNRDADRGGLRSQCRPATVVQLLIGTIVRSYQRSVIEHLRRLYALREANAVPSTRRVPEAHARTPPDRPRDGGPVAAI